MSSRLLPLSAMLRAISRAPASAARRRRRSPPRPARRGCRPRAGRRRARRRGRASPGRRAPRGAASRRRTEAPRVGRRRIEAGESAAAGAGSSAGAGGGASAATADDGVRGDRRRVRRARVVHPRWPRRAATRPRRERGLVRALPDQPGFRSSARGRRRPRPAARQALDQAFAGGSQRAEQAVELGLEGVELGEHAVGGRPARGRRGRRPPRRRAARISEAPRSAASRIRRTCSEVLLAIDGAGVRTWVSNSSATRRRCSSTAAGSYPRRPVGKSRRSILSRSTIAQDRAAATGVAVREAERSRRGRERSGRRAPARRARARGVRRAPAAPRPPAAPRRCARAPSDRCPRSAPPACRRGAAGSGPWQPADTGHAPQTGARGRQTVAPSSIIAWLKVAARPDGSSAAARAGNSRGVWSTAVAPRQHPPHVRVDRRDLRVPRERSDGRRRVRADPRQRRQVGRPPGCRRPRAPRCCSASARRL